MSPIPSGILAASEPTSFSMPGSSPVVGMDRILARRSMILLILAETSAGLAIFRPSYIEVVA